MTKTLTLEEKLAAIETSDLPIAFDGCHKIYLIENDEQRAEAEECGYSFHGAEHIRMLVNRSCFLVFVHPWPLTNDQPEHPWDIQQGEIDRMV